MKFWSSRRVLCLGTIALEQTTPGMRSWAPFPDVPYNINGRLHCTDIEVRLGTAFSIAANVTKVPIQARLSDTDVRGMNTATIVTRANARIARTQGCIRQEHYERPYGSSYSYTAELISSKDGSSTNQPTAISHLTFPHALFLVGFSS